MSRGSTTLAVCALLVAAGGLYVLANHYLNSSAQQAANTRPGGSERSTPVVLAPVIVRPETTRLEAVGTSRAIRSVMLHPAAPGEVVAVNIQADQAVQAGQVLLELDARDERLALELATAEEADATRTLERYLNSQSSGAVPTSEVDAARTALEVARIARSRADVALQDRSVRAPFAGRVGITQVDVGDRVSVDSEIASLDDRSALLVSFEVPEQFLGTLQVGDPVQVQTWTGSALHSEGRINDLGSRIDPVSRTFVARARVPNNDDRLRPGMSFRINLNLEGEPYPVVPEIAVQWGGDGAYVWGVNEGRAQRVAVEIVQRQGDQVLVAAELTEEDQVVVEGIQRMREDLPVENFNPETISESQALAQRLGG